MGLCMILERGAAPHWVVPVALDHTPVRKTLDLHWLDPPRPNGTLTVRAPLDAVGGDQHAAGVEAWARDVRAAWAPHHDMARGWLDRASPR
jgi:hypothetical protein